MKPSAGFISAALLALGCGSEPEQLPPFGEVLIEIDTNVAVPGTLGRLRVDLFADDGTWFESRDFATPNPSDFPLSMSVYNDSPSTSRSVLVRLRGYPEGRLRDYLGERFAERPSFEETPVAASVKQACAMAPLVPPEGALGARLPSGAFDDGLVSCGGNDTRSGLVAFEFEIEEAGPHRVEVARASPGHDWGFVADTLLSIRSACSDPTTEIACNDDANPAYDTLSGLTHDFDPGRYYALVGNIARGPMDVTLHVGRSAPAAETEPAPAPEELSREPRLVVDGVDVTPPREPQPALTIDRLALIRVEPGRQSTAHLLLDGECLGTMADWVGSRTCVDEEAALVARGDEPLSAGRQHTTTSAVGTWNAYDDVPCGSPPPSAHAGLFDERICISGGSFVLGDPSVIELGADSGQPERMAKVPAFFMDRYEYTVARYRAARRKGFEPPDGGPLNNFDPVTLDAAAPTRSCTWNETLAGDSLYEAQEELPLSCVSWLTARALCRFDGGDLPTVAEREYAAAAHGRAFETLYPWGETPPTCERALFGRWIDTANGSVECRDAGLGIGLAAVDREPWATNDVTPAGIVGLGGSLAEWTLDSHRSYDDACWRSQPLQSPRCWEDEAPLHTIMGGSFRDPAGRTRSASRIGGATAGIDPSVGFRCRYPGSEE